ncbi:hypothetical protein GKZ89_04040 [Bacillus mangrovi]|uniref:Small peptidoglycan-associated lipoprotein n=1 Tax=Metabacillus mangrovi TaxID=1491830 RepID=A0A7X2S384_9BACI|nr:hypothetical protein [Metabacillus mangrovi]MTH52567.1 hypothetical protein [Metabacillus mangrovi]
MLSERKFRLDRILLAAVIGPALLLSSCSLQEALSSTPAPQVQSKGKIIVFFSDGEKIEEEEQYYDALLDIKEEYPEEYEKMRVYQEEQKNPFGIKSFPSLLIMEDRKIRVHVEGALKTKDQILSEIKTVLSQ